MKRLGSEFELKEERDSELLRAYRMHIMEEGEVLLSDAVSKAINSPCSRFWVSDARALLTIRRMQDGHGLKEIGCLKRRSSKRRMYEEIYKRFLQAKERHPDWTDKELVSSVIRQPAPCFYLTVNSAIVIVHQIKKEWKKRHGLRLLR